MQLVQPMQTNPRLATKKLVPVMDSESGCPHRYSEEEGLVLEVDCRECQGPFDMANRRCMAGVISILACGPVPESVILTRAVQKRYRGNIVSSMVDLAAEFSALNRMSASTEIPSDRRCRTCPVSTPKVVASLMRTLADRPEFYEVEAGRVADEVRALVAQIDCERASKCVDMGLASSTIIR